LRYVIDLFNIITLSAGKNMPNISILKRNLRSWIIWIRMNCKSKWLPYLDARGLRGFIASEPLVSASALATTFFFLKVET